MLPVMAQKPKGMVWDIKRAKMPKLLTIIGYDHKEAYSQDWRTYGPCRPPETSHIGRNFWGEHEGELHEVGWELHQRYRQTIKRVHPDITHDTEEAVRVNLAYAKIRKLFALRGVRL